MKSRVASKARARLWPLALLPSLCASAVAQDITGAGATLPNPLYSRWFSEYHALHTEVRINYQPVGSGAGVRQVSQRVIDFGASDSPMTDRQMAESKVKLLHIPTVLGAVVPIYNLPGVRLEVHFAPDVLADIYLGVIERWNDPRLLRDNPGLALSDHAILPVYRSDGSGTTYIFTDFLSKTSAPFRARVGRGTSVSWPSGVGQKGNEGVAGLVTDIPYSLGYVELAYALESHAAYGFVRNAAGHWVKASVAAMEAAAAPDGVAKDPDFRESITDASGVAAYPITSFTWFLVPSSFADPGKGRAFALFLQWMLEHGEAEAASMGYAPLPQTLAGRVQQTLSQIH